MNKKMILFSILFLTFTLNGCTTAVVKETYSQDGKKAYTLSCAVWSQCYNSAGELCKTKGYDILNKVGVGENNALIQNNISTSKTNFEERSMLITCKE
jgi:hypothetical protein